MSTSSGPVRGPLGICILPAPPRNLSRSVAYPHYIKEILDHAGLCYRPVEWSELGAALADLRILVTIGETKPDDTRAEQLKSWTEAGGAWLAIGGVCGLAELFGVEVEGPTYATWGGGVGNLGEGYLKPEAADHPALAHLEIPLHYFNGLPVRAKGATVLGAVLDAHQRGSERAAFTVARVKAGTAMLLAPDVTGTVVRIQQGTAVTRDGVSAPDGTAPVADDVLKSDDGLVLDWIFDRQPVEALPGLSGFLQPIADQWRELVLRALFHLAVEHEVPLTLLWLYPRDLPALAHMSHDTDGNEIPKGWQLLETLAKADIRTSWCTILPGYPEDLTKAVAEAGHELAMHYDSMTEGTTFCEKEFREQFDKLVALFGGKRPVTNKNHYLRWEGDVDLFEWCERLGIGLDQSKGTSKTGEVGFNFGTCHTYFPLRPNGSVIDVLELPTPTQDLNVFAPPAITKPLLRAALRHHGILHLLFHPAHIDKPGVAESLIAAALEAKSSGMEWWTGEQINTWERARRRVRWSAGEGEGDDGQLCVTAEAALPGATILVLAPAGTPTGQDGESTVRWGFTFQKTILDLEPGREYSVTGRAECQTR